MEGGSLEGWESATSFSLLLVTLESCCCVGALEVIGVLWETGVGMRGVGGGIALFLPLVLCLFFLLFILASGDLGRDVGTGWSGVLVGRAEATAGVGVAVCRSGQMTEDCSQSVIFLSALLFVLFLLDLTGLVMVVASLSEPCAWDGVFNDETPYVWLLISS